MEIGEAAEKLKVDEPKMLSSFCSDCCCNKKVFGVGGVKKTKNESQLCTNNVEHHVKCNQQLLTKGRQTKEAVLPLA